jgi:hypothetical protein
VLYFPIFQHLVAFSKDYPIGLSSPEIDFYNNHLVHRATVGTRLKSPYVLVVVGLSARSKHWIIVTTLWATTFLRTSLADQRPNVFSNVGYSAALLGIVA